MSRHQQDPLRPLTADLRRPHEGGRACDAQKGKLLLEGVGHVLAPVIVPHGQTAPDPLSKAAKQRRTPWRIGSSASKRVARRAAWMPTHSAE